MVPFPILLATSNQGKQRELAGAFQDLPVRLSLPKESCGAIEVIEDGDSYVANARKKARAYWDALQHTRPPAGGNEGSGHDSAARTSAGAWPKAVLADDSGIEVDALDGAPGIYSARYAGVSGTGADEANNQKMLDALAELPEAKRTARFRCVLVYWDGSKEHIAEGSWEGKIGIERRGAGGFGYDPIFRLNDGRHAAELPAEEKFPICHRGIAAKRMEAWLAGALPKAT